MIPLTIPLPVILGHEASGTIAAIGEGVIGWEVGDKVASAISPDDGVGNIHRAFVLGHAREGGFTVVRR